MENKRENSDKLYTVNINGCEYRILPREKQIDIEAPGIKAIIHRSVNFRQADMVVKGASLEALTALMLYFNREQVPIK